MGKEVIKSLFLGFVVCLLIPSCITTEKLNYLQKDDSISEDNKGLISDTLTIGEIKNLIIETKDILEINLLSSNEEAVKMFSNGITSSTSRTNLSYTSGAPIKNGFKVNDSGYIFLPYIGCMKASGLATSLLSRNIEEKLKEYINDPIINVQISNFKISILGEVNTPGIYQIPNERINILEALSLAGDLTITGNRKSILLIRQTHGKREYFNLDLTNREFLSSELFYLKQNDIIYIESSKLRSKQLSLNFFSQVYSPFISTISVILSFVYLIR